MSTSERSEKKIDNDLDKLLDISSVGKKPAAMEAQASIAVKSSHDRVTPIDVYPWFEITVQNIDVTSQKWRASVEIHLFWQDYGVPAQNPNFEETDIKIENEDDLPIKMSEIFENKLWESMDFIQFKYLPETSTIYMLLVVSVEFVERMELHRFPMDRQFLGMDFNAWVGPDPNGHRLNWNWLKTPPEWVPKGFCQKDRTFAVRMLSTITEYEMMSPWVDFERDEPPLNIRLRVERQPPYYGSSIILPNFLIISVALCGFTIPIEDGPESEVVADRLSISVTLMLTAVAFKYVIQEQLPKITYLTVMDYYLNLGFMMITLLVFENAMMGIDSWANVETRQTIDRYIAYGFIGIWVVVHILWGIVCLTESFGRVSWNKMDELDKADSGVNDDDEDEMVPQNLRKSTSEYERDMHKRKALGNDGFLYAETTKQIGRPQSIENIREFKLLRGKSVDERKSMYQEKHPEIAKKDSE